MVPDKRNRCEINHKSLIQRTIAYPSLFTKIWQGVTHLLVNHQEASRIAALMRREDYLAPATPAARARLQAFLTGCLRPVGSAGPCELLALAGCDG